jgi:formylglycine-generating enzyme required for sulfatase activity
VLRYSSRVAIVLGLAIAASAAGAAEPTLTLDLGGGVSLDLVRIKAGVFQQGSPASETGHGDDETVREVTISADYYIGTTEITVGQWKRMVAETGYRSEAEKGKSGGFGWDGKALVQDPQYNWIRPGFPSSDRHPVTLVTYDDALAFTKWLTGRSHRAVTLPTEAQWEYAARAGSPARFPGGDRDAVAADIGWSRANAPNGPREVGLKKPNNWGLYDTAGNLYEWCLDWYGPYPPGPARDPLETRSNLSDKPRRVLRGGSWLKDTKALRSGARYRNAPGSRNADNGFRIVVSAEASPAATAPPAPRPVAGTGATAGGTNGGAGNALTGLALLGTMGLLCVGGPLALFFLVFRKRAGGTRTRIADDGFTLVVPNAKAGQRVHYRYRAGGETKTGQATITGDPADGVFVYTGERPSGIVLLAAADALSSASPPPPTQRSTATPARAMSTTTDDTDDDDDTDTDTGQPFRGFPSAY